MITWIKGHPSWIISLVLLAVSVFLLYSWLDALVTIDHVSSESERQKGMAIVLRDLLQESGKHTSRPEVTAFVKAHYSDKNNHVIKEGKNRLEVDGIIIIFHGTTISEVKFIGEK